MDNPKAAIDALLESTVQAGALKVYPLTVARYALLELIESPLVLLKEKELSVIDVIPSIYVMTAEASTLSKYNSRNLDKLKEDAADGTRNIRSRAAAFQAFLNARFPKKGGAA